MKNIIAFVLGLTLVGCASAPAKKAYYCMSPIGPIIGSPDNSHRKNDSVFVKNEAGQEAEVAFSNCVGVKEAE